MKIIQLSSGPHEFHVNVVAPTRVADYYKVPIIPTSSFNTCPNGSTAKELTDMLLGTPMIQDRHEKKVLVSVVSHLSGYQGPRIILELPLTKE